MLGRNFLFALFSTSRRIDTDSAGGHGTGARRVSECLLRSRHRQATPQRHRVRPAGLPAPRVGERLNLHGRLTFAPTGLLSSTSISLLRRSRRAVGRTARCAEKALGEFTVHFRTSPMLQLCFQSFSLFLFRAGDVQLKKLLDVLQVGVPSRQEAFCTFGKAITSRMLVEP